MLCTLFILMKNLKRSLSLSCALLLLLLLLLFKLLKKLKIVIYLKHVVRGVRHNQISV